MPMLRFCAHLDHKISSLHWQLVTCIWTLFLSVDVLQSSTPSWFTSRLFRYPAPSIPIDAGHTCWKQLVLAQAWFTVSAITSERRYVCLRLADVAADFPQTLILPARLLARCAARLSSVCDLLCGPRKQVRLIGDQRFRAEQKAKMAGINLDTTFFNRESPREQDYVVAFQFLFAQHDVLRNDGTTTPVRVPALCAQGAYERPC